MPAENLSGMRVIKAIIWHPAYRLCNLLQPFDADGNGNPSCSHLYASKVLIRDTHETVPRLVHIEGSVLGPRKYISRRTCRRTFLLWANEVNFWAVRVCA